MLDGLYTLREILTPAEQHNFAVGGFILANAEFADAILAAAQAENSPVILMVGPAEAPLLSLSKFARLCRLLAADYDIPVCLHLDHGLEVEQALEAVDLGFTSVMVDRSDYPWDENLADTLRVVEAARRTGASVESEIGHVGLADGTSSEVITAESHLTAPEEAEEFARATGVDALAVSVGNAHGLAPGLPELRFDLLEEIHRRVSLPLVLHGGSGRPADQVQRAISLGVRKVNIASELAGIFADTLAEQLQAGGGFFWHTVGLLQAKDRIQAAVQRHMRILGSSGQAGKYA